MKELAENRKDARPQQTDEDTKYEGVARHPLARRWLKRCADKETRKGVAAGPGEKRERHYKRAESLRSQLRPGGES